MDYFGFDFVPFI